VTAVPRPGGERRFLALAPMDGVTDHVYRDLVTGLRDGDSGISLCVSEFVRVTRGAVPAHVVRRHCPEVDHGGRTAAGVPVFVQILGGDPTAMADTAKVATEIGAPGIDINFGCPAKTVNNHDGGASILRAPCRIEAIVSAVRRAVPPEIPVSAKVRLGWDSAQPVEAIARAAEAGGCDWLTIHARTRAQGYRPPVDWPAIGRARAAVRVPVVANGDLDTVDAVDACAKASGCDAFMIGRGAMARPLLFRRLRGHAEPELDVPWLCSVLLDYAARLAVTGAPAGAVLGRLKQWLRLAAPAFVELRELFDAIKVLPDPEEARTALYRASTADPEARDHRPPRPTPCRAPSPARSPGP
jgi:tRNA-dihydrouridine synthase C